MSYEIWCEDGDEDGRGYLERLISCFMGKGAIDELVE